MGSDISFPRLQDDLISVTDGARRFFNDLPPDEGEVWAGRLRKHSRLFVIPPPPYPSSPPNHPSPLAIQ